MRRLFIIGVGADITDMGICEGNDLFVLGRVCEDFLIAGQRGIEHHLADRLSIHTDGLAPEECTVCQGQ